VSEDEIRRRFRLALLGYLALAAGLLVTIAIIWVRVDHVHDQIEHLKAEQVHRR
jgi:hypothetical protein